MGKNMKRILFIEDEKALQKTLSKILETAGFEVINAFDGEEGLALAQKELPDLILLDVILPKMNGKDVLGGLKAGLSTKDIPVIVLTNLESAEEVEYAIGHGATMYLVKANYELNDIVAKIKEIFSL